jgi:hypothetical protein
MLSTHTYTSYFKLLAKLAAKICGLNQVALAKWIVLCRELRNCSFDKMSETDFTISPLVNTIILEQIDAIVIQRYLGIFGALLVLSREIILKYGH